MIYLDYNATSPLRPSVRQAMSEVEMMPLNPSSVHSAGRKAKKLLEDARSEIASALGTFPNEIIFTASGTEANNLALRGFDRPILVSAIEHASNKKTAALLGGACLPVDDQGLLNMQALESQLKALGKPALVSVMLASNTTGVIQPISEIADIVHKYDGLLHCDAVQALGKIPLDWGLLKADMMTISGHKAGGPVGAAALLLRNDLPIRSLLTGGGQELGRRASTENIPLIVGFATLVTEVVGCHEAAGWGELRDWMENELLSAAPNAQAFSAKAPRLPNTSQFSMPGVSSETQLMHFDLHGFAISAGSACSSARIEPAYALLAMGVDEATASTAIRISFGWQTSEKEVKAFVEAWKQAYAKLSERKAA